MFMPIPEHWIRYCRHGCTVLQLTLLLVCQSANADTYQQLQALDKIRTQNFALFSDEMQSLAAQQAAMSEHERNYFRFLQIYRQIYLNGYAGVISDITAMLNSDIDANLRFRLAALAVNAHVITKDFRLAFSYADTILRSINDISDAFTLKQALAPVAMLFIDIGQQDLANYYINQLRQASDAQTGSCIADHLHFTLVRQQPEHTELGVIARLAIDSCEQIGELLWRDLTYVLWTKVLLEQADVTQAEHLLRNFKASALNSTYPLLVAATYTAAGHIAFLQQDYPAAKTNLTQALAKAQFNDSNEALLWANEIAYQLANAEGRYQDALSYYIKFSELSRKLDKERADKQFAFELVNSEMAVKNQSIELLNKDNEVLSLQKSVYEQEVRQTRIWVAALVVVLTVATVSAYRAAAGGRRFKKIAEFDQLTGISNRYHFNKQAAIAIDYSENNDKPVAVILFDLDHFKQINDQCGHAAGDWALQAVVKTCRNFMRNNDIFARIGGEEFVVVLPGCNSEKAVLLAEICCDAIASIDTSVSGQTFSLSASFGVSGSESSGYQLKQLLANADKAMYLAKQRGRNQVVSFTE
jgi:diguanylate cyclase